MPKRAFCPTCKEFTVIETIGICIECGAEKHRKYDYVPVPVEKLHYTEIKSKKHDEYQLELGCV